VGDVGAETSQYENVHPRLRYLAGFARRGTGGSRQLGLADRQPSQAVVRPHHAFASHYRCRTRNLRRSRAIAPALHEGAEVPRGQRACGKPAWKGGSSAADDHLERAIPILRSLEKIVHPRYPTPLDATKRVVGIAVMMLSARLLLAPIPLSNILLPF
jgi:Exopolysaccharide synthesis, ExoD